MHEGPGSNKIQLAENIKDLQARLNDKTVTLESIASQVKANDKGFLAKDVTVRDLVSHLGDIHHIFPREYLKKAGMARNQYNQIANYVYAQDAVNIKIGSKAPADYFETVCGQCEGGSLKYGAIDNVDELKANLAVNCIPASVATMRDSDYEAFLRQRRLLMAAKIRDYYFSL